MNYFFVPGTKLSGRSLTTSRISFFDTRNRRSANGRRKTPTSSRRTRTRISGRFTVVRLRIVDTTFDGSEKENRMRVVIEMVIGNTCLPERKQKEQGNSEEQGKDQNNGSKERNKDQPKNEKAKKPHLPDTEASSALELLRKLSISSSSSSSPSVSQVASRRCESGATYAIRFFF